MIAAVQLQELAQVIRGVSFDKEEALDEGRDGYLPILRAGNIDTDLLIDDDLVWVPDRRVAAEQRMRAGDIAICMSSGSQSVVGKTATLRRDWPGSVGAFCAVIRPQPDRVLPDWLALFLRSEVFRTWSRQSTGANIKNIRKSELEAFPVPVPPMAEQRRVVDLLSRAEGIVRLRRQAQQKAAALIPAIFVDMFGDPATNPKGWEVATLRDVLRVKSGDFLPANKMDPNGTVPVYGGNGINGHHSVAMFRDARIVIGRVGAHCGNVHLTRGPSWITDNALFVADHDQRLDTYYLLTALRHARLIEPA